MRLTWESISLKLHTPFRVSYGASETREAYWLRLEEDSGWGEGTIPPYYGVAVEEMTGYWRVMSSGKQPFPNLPAEISRWIGTDGPAPARCALDMALHDRLGRLTQKPLYQLLDLPRPKRLATSFTIGIDTPEIMAQAAARIPNFPIIKVKLGSEDDSIRLAAIRSVRPEVRLWADANAAWTVPEAIRRLDDLRPYNLELVEQPVGRDDFEGISAIQAIFDYPIVADESLQSIDDLERLAAAGVRAVNVKLMKVGGLAPAVRILWRARELGMRIMLGCMVETSLGVTAMAHLSGLADWLDLDAPLLVANDPFDGLTIDERAAVHLPQRPGIGVVRNNKYPIL